MLDYYVHILYPCVHTYCGHTCMHARTHNCMCTHAIYIQGKMTKLLSCDTYQWLPGTWGLYCSLVNECMYAVLDPDIKFNVLVHNQITVYLHIINWLTMNTIIHASPPISILLCLSTVSWYKSIVTYINDKKVIKTSIIQTINCSIRVFYLECTI